MEAARRAAKDYRPRPILIIIFVLAIALLLAATVVGVNQRQALAAQAQKPPVTEYRNWDHFIPVASPQCLKAIELGDAAIRLGLQLDEVTTYSMEAQREGRLNEALKGFAKADKLADATHRARTAYDRQAERCVKS